MVRLPVLGPRDLMRLADRGYDALEKAIALVPRVTGLLGEVEQVVRRVNSTIDGIDDIRKQAQAVVDRTDAVVARAEHLVDRTGEVVEAAASVVKRTEPVVERAAQAVAAASDMAATAQKLLGDYEPTLTKLAPMAAKLAATTSPKEVQAVVELIDTLPDMVDSLKTDILPILHTLGSVAPDVRDLLDTTKEFNEILGSLPGLGRIKKRVEERQEHQDHRVPIELPPGT